eukprot:TCONS_00004441-protein
MTHLNDNNVLSDYQHGFREKRSCMSQLLTTVNDFARNLNDKKQTDSILLDFSKAFDKVNYFKICLKASHYVIGGTTLKWIKAFLSNRTQQVLLNRKSSDTANVLSGVPQGTVLGPLLFLIYINDMPSYKMTSQHFSNGMWNFILKSANISQLQIGTKPIESTYSIQSLRKYLTPNTLE